MKFFLFTILTAACLHLSGGDQDIKLWYIPFAAKTDVPITTKKIERCSNVVLFNNLAANSDSFRSLITDSRERMDSKNIRLKLLLGKDIYYFDALGNGTINGKGAVHVDVDRFQKLVSPSKINVHFGTIE